MTDILGIAVCDTIVVCIPIFSIGYFTGYIDVYLKYISFIFEDEYDKKCDEMNGKILFDKIIFSEQIMPRQYTV